MTTYIDITNQRFGRLTALTYAGNKKWNCKCDCGKACIVKSINLRKGHTQSCGCLHRESAAATARKMGHANTKHGLTNTREYETWHHMRQRCFHSNIPEYKHYGGRGITICERWQSFQNFYEDMGKRPDGCSLDRIDPNANYSKENCRWATQLQQQRNRRARLLFELNGECKMLTEWAEQYGRNYILVWKRMKNGWSLRDALTQPITPRGKARLTITARLGVPHQRKDNEIA